MARRRILSLRGRFIAYSGSSIDPVAEISTEGEGEGEGEGAEGEGEGEGAEGEGEGEGEGE